MFGVCFSRYYLSILTICHCVLSRRRVARASSVQSSPAGRWGGRRNIHKDQTFTLLYLPACTVLYVLHALYDNKLQPHFSRKEEAELRDPGLLCATQ